MPINPRSGEWCVSCIQPELKEPLLMEVWDTEDEAEKSRSEYEKVEKARFCDEFKWIVERRLVLTS